MSVDGSELWFFLSLVGWVGGCVMVLALCVLFFLSLSLRSFSRSLYVVLSLALSAFFLSDSLCFA